MTQPDPRPSKRVKASREEWQALRELKAGECRICGIGSGIQLHHLVGRDLGGDDVADNLCGLCWICHPDVEERHPQSCLELGLRLTESELGYVLNKKGPDFLARYYRVGVQVAGYPVREAA